MCRQFVCEWRHTARPPNGSGFDYRRLGSEGNQVIQRQPTVSAESPFPTPAIADQQVASCWSFGAGTDRKDSVIFLRVR